MDYNQSVLTARWFARLTNRTAYLPFPAEMPADGERNPRRSFPVQETSPARVYAYTRVRNRTNIRIKFHYSRTSAHESTFSDTKKGPDEGALACGETRQKSRTVFQRELLSADSSIESGRFVKRSRPVQASMSFTVTA